MLNRIAGYAERRESARELPRGSALVLRDLFLRGEIARGDVPRIIGASPRTGQKVTAELLTQRLVTSSSPKGPLRLGFLRMRPVIIFPICILPARIDDRNPAPANIGGANPKMR